MKGEHISLVLGILALMSLLVLSVGAASALTWVNPTASQSIKGTITFNVSTSFNAVKNCTFYQDTTVFAFTANATGNQPSFTTSNNTALLTQSASTSINATCRNSSGAIDTAKVTIAIDNNAPTCSFSVDYDERKYMDVMGVATTQSSSDALTAITYAWTLWDPGGTIETSKTSSEPTFSGTDFDNIGDYILGLTVTDAASNSATCTNQTIMVRGSNDDETVQTVVAIQEEKRQNNTTFILVVGAVAIILIISIAAWIALNSSKKRR